MNSRQGKRSPGKKLNLREPFEKSKNSSALQNNCILLQYWTALGCGCFPAAAAAKAPWRKDSRCAVLGRSLENGFNSPKQGDYNRHAVCATIGADNHHGVALF